MRSLVTGEPRAGLGGPWCKSTSGEEVLDAGWCVGCANLGSWARSNQELGGVARVPVHVSGSRE